MARLRRSSSDSFINDTSEDDALLKPLNRTTRSSPRKRNIKQYAEPLEDEGVPQKLVLKTFKPSSVKKSPKKQIRLAPLNTLQTATAPLEFRFPATSTKRVLHIKSPKKSSNLAETAPALQATKSYSSVPPAEEEVDVEQSIWCGEDPLSSDSEDELPSPSTFKPSRFKPTLAAINIDSLGGNIDSDISDDDIVLHKKPTRMVSSPGTSSDKENDVNAVLHFSPPVTLSSPPRWTTPPPSSPKKGKLVSPSKTRQRIPTPPLQPNLDAFWDAQTVNEWNDQYSPRKEWRSPSKPSLNLHSSSSNPSSPPSSPSKKISASSPTKRTKSQLAALQNWNSTKHTLAQTFLCALDTRITSNRISALAASTGGIQITWSKTLNTTAGRANWRRETTKSKDPITQATTTSNEKHFATIELAEKVIDCEERLYNVLAHEFCHLCNFMISGIKDRPHGVEFQDWGRKVGREFGKGKGWEGVEIKVTTRHEYAIEYKFLWRCGDEAGCGAEYGRHSRSIDVRRQRCGRCKGALVQIRPVPRKGGEGNSEGKGGGGYAGYVKEQFAKVKEELGGKGVGSKTVMGEIGRRYRVEKEKGRLEEEERKGSGDAEVDGVARRLEFVRIGE